MDNVIMGLATTERNFKLGKDESTQHLEQAKIEKDVDLEMFRAFKDFLKTYEKGKGG